MAQSVSAPAATNIPRHTSTQWDSFAHIGALFDADGRPMAIEHPHPASAMFVLEAMGEWCRANGMRVEINGPAYVPEFNKTKPANWSVTLWKVAPSGLGATASWIESADTPAEVVFACAAELVERM